MNYTYRFYLLLFIYFYLSESLVLYLELGNVNKLKFFKGNKGLIMVQTKKYILLGTYKENMYPSVCVEAIEKLGDF